MKKIIITVIVCIFILTLGIIIGVAAAKKFDPNNMYVPVKKLYAKPDLNSEVVFEVPIEFALTGMTSDEAWYRVKIAFDFLGHHEYIGWTKIF